MKIYKNLFQRIISAENLFAAWDVFKADKRKKPDVIRFEWQLEQNIFQLHRELRNKTYKHGPYTSFHIVDPKQRHIHKALVRDRVLHHAIFSIINPIFEETFIPTSFSCRVGYGTHKGIETLTRMARSINNNGTTPCFVLKCDIQKFFDSVDHEILLTILKRRIKDEDTIWLLQKIIDGYSSAQSLFTQKGVPIGNLTSQLFANVYMNEFDQFMKQVLKTARYVRYTDDFVVVSADRQYLEKLLPPIAEFLDRKLALRLHPRKVSIRKLVSGVDFLGQVTFPHHRLIRTKTKRRIFRKMHKRISQHNAGKLSKDKVEQTLSSYLGGLSHADALEVSKSLLNDYWLSMKE